MSKKYFNSSDARLLISTYGFALFPIHGVKEDGTCTCNNSECKSIGKHPATPDGFKSASKDIEQVKRLWSGRSGLNVGIATGEASGVFVVDIDDPKAEIELNKLIKLPATYTVKTGRGKHLYFKYDPSRPVKNGAHVISGVDIRGDGGYVAGAGSNHATGVTYEAINPLEDFADAPEGLYELMLKKDAPIFNNTAPSLLNSLSTGWTDEQRREHLSFIDPDLPHDDWVKVGMALHADGNYYHLFDEWSSKGTKYEGSKSTQAKWNSFSRDGGVTYGTIVAAAKEGGWVYRKTNPVLTAPPSPLTKEAFDPDTGEIIEAKTERRMYYIKGSDMDYTPDDRDFVQGLLTSGGMSVVYGESNCGKTFFMTDLAFHVSQSKKWRDRRVEGGVVIYVALEGVSGLRGRVEAYKRHSKSLLESFLVMPCAFDFLDGEGDVTEFLDLLKEAKDDVGDVKLIVIDTLARAIGGGDENSGQDMGILVKHADAIRAISGAHICFVHHSGKDKAKGARGHSSLRAAVDTEIEVSRSEGADYSSVKVVKQRDMDIGDPLDFKLARIELGENRHGEMTSSCIVEPYSVADDMNRVRHIKPNLKVAFDAFLECVADRGRIIQSKEVPKVKVVSNDDFRAYLENRGLLSDKESSARVQYSNYRKELIASELVVYRGGYLWIM